MQSYERTYRKQTENAKESCACGSCASTPGGGAGLDTLAQLRTNSRTKEILSKRARAKYITNGLVMRLADLRSPLRTSYWNSFHCCRELKQNGKKLTSKYCNARWCLVCNRVRVAKLINGYAPVLDELADKYFVTLTIPNVPAEELPGTVEKMYGAIRRIGDNMRKRDKLPIRGIRKFECTYNAHRRDFHPHYHLIVSGKAAAELLVTRWLEQFPEAVAEAQDVKKADSKSVLELFKYFTKLFTSKKDTSKRTVNIRALDVIFRAMEGKRVFQPMGIKKAAVSEDIEEVESQVYEELEETDIAIWTWDRSDWVDESTGELLTGYYPSERVLELMQGFNSS